MGQLFEAYGLKPVRETELFCDAHGVNQVPEEEYLNQLHYSPAGGVIPLVLDEILAQLSNPVKPKVDVASAQTGNQPDCKFISDFSGGKQYLFRNSILSTAIYLPLSDSPLAIRIPKGSWTVAGAIVMRSTVPSVLAFEFDGVSTRISLGHKNRNYKKSLLGYRQFNRESDIIVNDASVVLVKMPAIGRWVSNGGVSALTLEEAIGHGLISLILEPSAAIRPGHGGAEDDGTQGSAAAG